MNDTIYVDSPASDDSRRERLFRGQLFVFTPTPEARALRDFAFAMIEEAFAPLDPLEAQHHLTVDRFVEIFGPLKPRFIHHPRTMELMRALLSSLGCDPHETFLDVPRLRGVTSDSYLTAGVGYAHPLHRDTWWSAPLAQLNWWMPLCEIESESSMAFHPRFWSEGVENHSEEFNYYEWNAVGRAEAARYIHDDPRKQPHPPADIDPEPQVRLVCPPSGVVLFSGAQMHSTVANTSGRTRYSIDFRTVNLADLEAGRSAPNADSRPLGTSLRDFRRMADLEAMPANVVARYDSGPVPEDAVLVFQPDSR